MRISDWSSDVCSSDLAHILSVSQRAHLSDMAREKILGMQREFRASCGALLKALRPEVSDKDIEFIFFSMQQLALYGIWHSTRRSLLPRQEYREVLERGVRSEERRVGKEVGSTCELRGEPP